MARAAAALCRALVRRGHEVTVATCLFSSNDLVGRDVPGDETRDGVRVRRFVGPALLERLLVPWPAGLPEFLSRSLTTIDVAHVHGHRNGLAVTAARALRAAARPFVLQPHGTFPHHGQHRGVKALFDAIFGNTVVAHAAAVVAVSEAEARDLPGKPRTIPNGIEAPGSASRSRPRGRPRLLFVGTDRTQKRADRLPRLLDALPAAELHLVGPFTDRFRRSFLRHGERAVFTGVRSEGALAAEYADADLVVHPAVGEAFGFVPFEAALCGTAAVVAGGHGCGEWFSRAGGCVVPPDDAPSLLAAVRARLQEPGVGAAEARAVAAFARAELDWNKTAEAMESVYSGVLAGVW
jgi:glycosyltransferase involved in cell wall biosynthesis